MTVRRTKTTARVGVLAFATVIAAAASTQCNIFQSLDRCDSDSDCVTGRTCDPEGKFCVGGDSGVPSEAAVVDVAVDAAPDRDAAPPPACDHGKPYQNISLVKGLEDRAVFSARFTANEKVVLLSISDDADGGFDPDLFSAVRPDPSAPFAVIGKIAGVNTTVAGEYWPTITADQKLLFFESGRSLQKDGGAYETDKSRIWSASRVNTVSDFEEPKIQSLFVLPADSDEDFAPYLHPSGRSLYFASFARGALGESDIFVATLDEVGFATTITNVTPVNTSRAEHAPLISLDDKELYFAREDESASRLRHIFVARRSAPGAPFGTASPVTELDSAYEEFPSWLSDDRCRLYFLSNRPTPTGGDGGAIDFHLWVAQRPPP